MGADHLEHQWGQIITDDGLPSPSDAARWLYAALKSDPSSASAHRLLNKLSIPLLHAAVVRAFRLCGRANEIEDTLARTSSVWLAVKCLQERRWVRDSDPDLCSRLRIIMTKAPCGGSALLNRIVDEMDASRHPLEAVASPSSVPRSSPPLPNPVLDYAAAVRALRGASDTRIDVEQPIALSLLNREEAQRLIALADPANDLRTAAVRFTPALIFTAAGHVVGQQSWTSAGGTSVSDRLRPAIAAANRYDLPIPWHRERLQWPWINTYAAQFIASLGVQGDADRLYQVLEADADILLPFLGRHDGLKATEGLLDERLAPTLQRCLSLGDDEFFESLCNLVLQIPSESAVPILAGLFGRWAASFDITTPAPSDGIALWRGFARLREHPRFREVSGWRQTLESLLATNIQWFHKQDIVRVLEMEPASYVAIESRLSREENWVHFNRCEIDRLDEAAAKLFDRFC